MRTKAILICASLWWCSACHPLVAPTNPNRIVLPAEAAESLLHQCSRSAPKLGEGGWQPTNKDLDALEQLLPTALSRTAEARKVNFNQVLDNWRRQYVGVVRGGRKYIYGNFFPRMKDLDWLQWETKPTMICDGGPEFFGVEFDVMAHSFTRIDFNGGPEAR